MTNKSSPLSKYSEALKNEILTANPGLFGVGLALYSTDGYSTDSYSRYLTDDEIIQSKNRLNSMHGRLAAKDAINQALNTIIPYKEISILSSSSSRPVIHSSHKSLKERGNLALSITHEDSLASAIAISADHVITVGIDIARIDRVEKAFKNKKVLDYVLTNEEQKLLKQTPDAALFWSCKEAAAKALGIGIWHGGYLQDIELTNISGAVKLIFKNKLLELFNARDYSEIKIYQTTDGIYKLSVALIAS